VLAVPFRSLDELLSPEHRELESPYKAECFKRGVVRDNVEEQLLQTLAMEMQFTTYNRTDEQELRRVFLHVGW
jgi:hypothetical protein